MKTKQWILSLMMALLPALGFTQEWDDIYADPSANVENQTQKQQQVKQKDNQSQKKAIVVVEGDASNIEVYANGRNIDEYNRRNNTQVEEGEPVVDEYTDYQYTDRIVKFHDPESSIKITGADNVTIYVGDDLYSDYYENRGWNTSITFGWGWPPYYSWYYGSRYRPWHYSSWYYPWYDPWYSYWYDPWYYGGWYSPWYYSWYSPGYYGGWYSPWYGSPWYGGGYYSNIRYNRSGRSSGSYRSSASGVSTDSRITSGNSRSSRSTTVGTSAGRSSYRNSQIAPRTRIVDESGRIYNSRTGETVSRTISPSTRSSSAATVDRSGNTNSTRQSSNTYQRPSNNSSTRQSATTGRSYSTPSRSESTSRSSTYSTPSRSYDNSSTRSSSVGSSSSSRSSSGSSGGSGRSSGSGRR